MRLDGKVCVITGAGGGMGREGAIVFTGEGAKVCVADIDYALAEETVGLCPEGSAFPLSVNVAVDTAVTRRLIEKGWPIFLWTPDEAADISAALAKGPYGVISNEPVAVFPAPSVAEQSTIVAPKPWMP